MISRYFISAVIPIAFLVGCEGVQVNVPVEVQTLKREDAALKVLVENKSNLYIKIIYPVQTGMLKPNQYTVFSLPNPGNYKVVITAYEKSKKYQYDYKEIKTVEMPIFLNGYDILRAKGGFVGYSLAFTDGMFSPDISNKLLKRGG